MIQVLVLAPFAFAAIYLAVAFGLIASQRPEAAPAAAGDGLDFTAALAQDHADLPPVRQYKARDGTMLPYRRYDGAAPAVRLIVLLHGSGWHGMQFHAMALSLAQAGLGSVIVPDLRGHGEAPARRGDIDHIGQFEEDIADLITGLTTEGPRPQIVLGGHSSGGGLVVRFAGGAYGRLADAFILMAPFLRHDAPTTRPRSGGWAQPAVRRIIGLTMLNRIGIRSLNGLPVIAFAMPRSVLDGPFGHTATTVYSYRLNVSYAPRPDYGADLKALDRPFLLIAGEADEAFYAERYESEISRYTNAGSYRLLPGVGHLGLVSERGAIEAVKGWLAKL